MPELLLIEIVWDVVNENSSIPSWLRYTVSFPGVSLKNSTLPGCDKIM